jgi:hypothetical protein
MTLPNSDVLEELIKAAFRTEWRTVTKCSLVSTQLQAFGDGRYVRTDGGSFLDDGFDPGDEAIVSGWAGAGNNGMKGLESVTADTVKVLKPAGMVDEAAGPSVTIAMGIPSRQKLDGMLLDPSPFYPWLREAFQPDNMRAASIVVRAGKPMQRLTGLYWLTTFYPKGAGSSGVSRLRGKFMARIYAGRSLVYQGSTIRIRTASPKPFVEETNWISGALAFAFQADALVP